MSELNGKGPKVKPEGGFPRKESGKKRCYTCHQMKEVLEFGSDRSSWDGLQRNCKKCRSKFRKRAYLANMEKEKAAAKERHRLNTEKIRNAKANGNFEEKKVEPEFEIEAPPMLIPKLDTEK